jgi:hypothetical protein
MQAPCKSVCAAQQTLAAGARAGRALALPGGARQELAVLVLLRVLVGGEEEEVLREVRQPGQPRRVAQPARAHLPGTQARGRAVMRYVLAALVWLQDKTIRRGRVLPDGSRQV